MKDIHLKRCQVSTPPEIVELTWQLVEKLRPNEVFDSVLDLGCGDARFSASAHRYRKYTGIERDPAKLALAASSKSIRLVKADALSWRGSRYSLCIGNPPYIRHHGLEPAWRDDAIASIEHDGGPQLKRTANAFIIFLAKALISTRPNGVIAQVIPYEWVTRPSALELREYIKEQGWDVYVYRFEADIFPTVLTTASITLIDKNSTSGKWVFGQIGSDHKIRTVAHPSGTRSRVLAYSDGHKKARAIRGLSPGGQDIFLLTEQQRLLFGLKKRIDVIPAIASLRCLKEELEVLDKATFESLYVDAGRGCWLIRTDRETLSPQLRKYLKSLGDSWKRYTTCTLRETWWRYVAHPIPQLLVSSGFTKRAPKVLVNKVGAMALGSVYGVMVKGRERDARSLAKGLRHYDYQARLVHHANDLKKLEVRQLNSVISQVLER